MMFPTENDEIFSLVNGEQRLWVGALRKVSQHRGTGAKVKGCQEADTDNCEDTVEPDRGQQCTAANKMIQFCYYLYISIRLLPLKQFHKRKIRLAGWFLPPDI